MLLFLILKKSPQVSIRSHNHCHFKDLYRDHYVPTFRLPSRILTFVGRNRKQVYISFQLLKLYHCPCYLWNLHFRKDCGGQIQHVTRREHESHWLPGVGQGAHLLSWLCRRRLTWITPSIMLTILLTIAITLWVRSAGLTSGLYWQDNTYRHAMYNTYVGDNLKWTVELLV